MVVSKIINGLKVIQVAGDTSKEITGVSLNSKEIQPGNIFVACKGSNSDGHKFIPEALANGAAAIVCDNPELVPENLICVSNCVKIVVSDSRKAFAKLSTVFYGNPSQELTMIGITGTKGKTTTSYFIKHLLESTGHKSGLIGTIANYIGQNKIDTKLTTPESNQINYLLKEMITDACTHCIMEVSSHSLVLQRAAYLDFDFAVFTNITSDHLDFHNDFETYLSAKKILFDGLNENAYAIVNGDDENSKKIIEDCRAQLITFGMGENNDFSIANINYDLNGTSFTVSISGKQIEFFTQLIGTFNAYNATVAIVIGHRLGIGTIEIQNAIKSTPHVPGRFEVLSSGRKKIIIDYSHTTDSLRHALNAIKHITKSQNPVHTVFGCGGDRDKTKRPLMGQVADELSTQIYITSDNPRTENPNSIIEQIKKGVKRNNPFVIENREEAIKKAVCDSEENAVVLIAGKGHENYQEINGVRNHFSDKETAEKYLKLCQN